DVAVSFGARRRCPFLREGPNGFVLRVEVETLDPLALSMLPSPSKSWFLCGLGLGSDRRDRVMTGLGIATRSRRPTRHDGPMRHDLSRETDF
ncbi:hypothetical protein Taro_054089, partial [Colocasia esculenta]|nr:hypothetical protein [Colocasia esculenta]